MLYFVYGIRRSRIVVRISDFVYGKFFAHSLCLHMVLCVNRISFDVLNSSAFFADNEFPGDHTDGATPDPIPNSEAKSVRPMVVLTGESR